MAISGKKEQHTMMEGDGDGEEEDLTPFWLQNTADIRRGDRLRRGVSSFFFSSGLLVFFLLVTAVAFVAVALPSTLSFSAQIFKPNSVKKSWDSLNVVLVLVAVVFGFLSRNKNEERYGYYDEFQQIPRKENEAKNSSSTKWDNYETDSGRKLNLLNSREWYEYSDVQAGFDGKHSFLKRNSSSYPDLRGFSAVELDYGDHRRRFYDDFYADGGRVSDSDQGRVHRRHRSLEQFETLRPPAPPQTKSVIVDTSVSKSNESESCPMVAPSMAAFRPPSLPQTKTAIDDTLVSESNEAENFPPPPPSMAVLAEPSQPKGKTRKERSKRKPSEDTESTNFAAVTTPPPPPPPPPLREKSSKSDRKRGGTTGNATKDFLNSLYHKKKKKQRQKSVDKLDSLLHEAQSPLSFHIPALPQSPQPPSSPPPSVLQNLFSSKKQKRKRTIKVAVASPSQRQPNPNFQDAPKPTTLRPLEKLEVHSNSGGESPLNRHQPPPPPPPPPPFKSPVWKFVVQGDYVRVNSTTSSRSGSPDPDELDSDVMPSAADGGDTTPFHPSPLFCASPDVNTKAESFITNFRAKLKLEKIHSMKKREPGLSSLGPRQI